MSHSSRFKHWLRSTAAVGLAAMTIGLLGTALGLVAAPATPVEFPLTRNSTAKSIVSSLTGASEPPFTQRVYLPLIARNHLQRENQLGLAFVSSAEAFAGETRYQRALDIDGRINRWPMYWPNVEKNPVSQPRVFDWSRPDTNIAADINHGFEVLPILMLTPIGLDTAGSRSVPPPRVGDGLKSLLNQRTLDWPTQPSSQGSPPQGLHLSVFTDGSDEPGLGKSINPDNRWAYFVNAAVKRYKPGGTLAQAQGWSGDKGVSEWEIWNEEDLNQFFIGTPADYARLLKVAYVAVKQADPNATIAFGGLAHFEKPDWLNDVLNVIAADPMSATYHGFMDAVASHNYTWAWRTFGYLYEDRVRLDAHGFNTVKLWLTETGVPVCDDPPYLFCPSLYRSTMSEQADYLIQSVAWSMWMSAEKVIWFQLYDDGANDCKYDAFGLVRNPPAGPCTARDGTPRPAYDTFKVAGQYLSGVQPYWRLRYPSWSNPIQEWLAFKRPETGQRIVVMWNRYYTGTETAIISATAPAALLVYPNGVTQTLMPVDGVYTIDLPAATNLGAMTSDGKLPDGTSPIGGRPRILVEDDPSAQ